MSIEQTLRDLIGPLVGQRISPDTLDYGGDFPATIYQQVGGRAGWYVERAKPGHKHGRFQFTTWAKTRLEANQVARAIEDAICLSALIAEPYGAPTALYNESLALYGARQDFGIWFPD